MPLREISPLMRILAAGLIGLGSVLPAGALLAATPLCGVSRVWNRTGVTHGPLMAPLSVLQIAADPSVIYEGGVYRMWFTNADSAGRTGIAYAQSPDGIQFSVWHDRVRQDPIMDLVLAPRAASDWNGPGIETPMVLRTPAGRLRMYYTANLIPAGSVTYAIGVAESDDGTHWTQAAKPVLEAKLPWEQPLCKGSGTARSCATGGVLEPTVVYDAAHRLYRMWYVGLGQPANSFRTYRIGYATSADGLVWQRNPDPVLPLGGPGAWDELWTSHVEVVADPVAGYHMFYFGSAKKDYVDGAEIQRGSIGHAYSPDGLSWTRDPANPILAPRPGEVDAWSLGGPTALIQGGKMRMWYYASPTSGLRSSIVLAEASCG